MNVLILSSASTDIDPYYGSIARSISNCLARNGFDLVFGGASHSMMGICYEEFIKNDRQVYAFTTEKYQEDLVNLKKATPFIKESTFDMKRDMFNASDVIVVLPGGIGTLSELLSYIEENRSNDKEIPIEVYDEDGYYQKFFELLEFMKNKNFTGSNILDLVNISRNKDEFIDHMNNYMYGKRRK